MRVASADPGLSGGLALIDTKTGEAVVDDMPLVPVPKIAKPVKSKSKKRVKRKVCGTQVADWLERHRPDVIVIEQVGAMPGQGVVSMFTFGEAYGTLLGAAGAMNVPIVYITPQRWKKVLGLLGKSKDAARVLARRKFKRLAPQLARKRDIGRADALMIGHAYTMH